jgi:hypothetical protein
MDLFLRKAIHPQADNNYRVIIKDEGAEIELGSIGVQFDGWHWGIGGMSQYDDPTGSSDEKPYGSASTPMPSQAIPIIYRCSLARPPIAG